MSKLVLSATTTVAEVKAALGDKRTDPATVLEWAKSTALPAEQSCQLGSVLTGADLADVFTAQLRFAERAKQGGNSATTVKIGNAGGVVLYGKGFHAAPFAPLNLKAQQAIGVILQAAAIVDAIEKAIADGQETVESRESVRKDKDGNEKTKVYSVAKLGPVVVSTDTVELRLELAKVKAIAGHPDFGRIRDCASVTEVDALQFACGK